MGQRPISADIEKQIVDWYQAGYTIKDIAERMPLSAHTVRKALRRNGIASRTGEDQKQLRRILEEQAANPYNQNSVQVGFGMYKELPRIRPKAMAMEVMTAMGAPSLYRMTQSIIQWRINNPPPVQWTKASTCLVCGKPHAGRTSPEVVTVDGVILCAEHAHAFRAWRKRRAARYLILEHQNSMVQEAHPWHRGL